jgi:putative Mn2+ efflux pump MntP
VGKWLLSRWRCNFSPDNNLCQKKKKFAGHRELSLSQILVLGCALSMNNIGIGFSASITGLPFLPASVSTFFCSFGFLAFGSRLGRSAFLQQIGEYTDPVSGLLLILLGLCQLYH